MMHDKNTLIFDLDGTLVNSMDRLTHIAANVMAEFFGLSKTEGRRLYQLTSGLPFSQQLETLYPSETRTNFEAAQLFEKKKRETYFEEEAFPDTLETMHYLKKRGYHVIISSNSEQDLVTQLVEQLSIPCDMALGFKGSFAKGMPHLLHILEELERSPTEMVFVGDSLRDGEKAFECGIDFIGKEGMFSREDFLRRFPNVPVISKLAELREIF